MSITTYLHGTDSNTIGRSAAPDAFELCSRNLPVLWLALFGEEDMRSVPDDHPDSFARWYFTAVKSHALERLAARRECLLAVLPEGAEHVYAMFVQFLEGSSNSHVQCDPNDLLGLQDADEGWETAFKQMLHAFDNAPYRTVLKKRLFRVREEKELSPGWKLFYRYFEHVARRGFVETERSFAGVLAGGGELGETPWDQED